MLTTLLLAATMMQVPDTEIYLAPLRLRDGWVAIGTPRNITNRAGYDNQPMFTRDGRAILYTSRIDDRQTDIFRYDLRAGKSSRVTNTPESEYSPTPFGDGFSVIRVEADSTQRLWRFGSDGSNPRVLFPAIKPVGYHAWIDQSRAGLFVLGTPATLQLASLQASGAPRLIAQDIGRSIQRIPRWNGVSYVQRMPDTTAWIRRVNGETFEVSPIARLPRNGEYHAWTPRGALVATADSKIMEWTPINGGSWREIIDMSTAGVRVSRVAISPLGDWIAFVGERAPQTR